MKIFQIGFNKCGTRSISHFFKRHGLTTADWERGEIAKSIREDVASARLPLSDWSDRQVFSDMEFVTARDIFEGYREFRALASAYEDALFILNTRNGEAWIRSRHSHGDGGYTEAYRRFLRLETHEQVFERWRRDWYSHHADVLEYFSGELANRLFVWDIEAPDFKQLQTKVNFEIKREFWIQRGKTKM